MSNNGFIKLAEFLKECRFDKGIKISQLASITQISEKDLYDVEKGADVSIEIIWCLFRFYGYNFNEFTQKLVLLIDQNEERSS